MVLVVNIIGQRYEMVGLLFEADCMSLVPQAYSSLGKKKKKDVWSKGAASFTFSVQ